LQDCPRADVQHDKQHRCGVGDVHGPPDVGHVVFCTPSKQFDADDERMPLARKKKSPPPRFGGEAIGRAGGVGEDDRAQRTRWQAPSL